MSGVVAAGTVCEALFAQARLAQGSWGGATGSGASAKQQQTGQDASCDSREASLLPPPAWTASPVDRLLWPSTSVTLHTQSLPTSMCGSYDTPGGPYATAAPLPLPLRQPAQHVPHFLRGLVP